ncbi:MAG: hypothetical protein N2111_06690 [Candidatus Sumerlaeaceae bacterium]|nr:hypothetical protein [Candidatus Sumerlaeaceae bacterium]
MQGRWSGHGAGALTPGYPAMLALAFSFGGEDNWHAVVAVQFLLGSATPFLFYWLYRPLLRSRVLAALAGGAFLLDRVSLGLQTVPLTEPLAALTLTLALAVFVWSARKKTWLSAIIAGLTLLLNYLVRPSFQLLYVVLVTVGVVVELSYRDGRARWRQIAAHYAVIFLMVFAGARLWSWFSVVSTGSSAATINVYAQMINHTGNFMHLAPDKHARIRDIYVRELKAAGGNNANLLIKILGTLMNETGMTREEVEREIGEISRYLVWHHPFLYLEQVWRSWQRLWSDNSQYITDMTDPDGSGTGRIEITRLFRNIVTNPLTRGVYGFVERVLWANPGLLRLIPWVLVVLAVAGCWLRRDEPFSVLAIICVIGAIFYHMGIHALMQFTEFGRYKLPVQALWFTFGLMLLLLIMSEAVTAWRRHQAQRE